MSIKSWLVELIVKREIKKIQEGNMKDLLTLLDKGLSLLPFNGNKTNIGTVISFLGVVDVLTQASLPFLHAIAPFLPPVYVVGIGASVTAIGGFHQLVKKIKDNIK